MQLLFVIVLLAAVLSADLVSGEPVADGGLRVLLTAGTVALVMLFAQVAAGVTSRRLQRDFTQRAAWMQRFALWKTLHLILWATASVAILFGLEWTRLVRVNWQLAGTFMLDEVLILLPVVCPLLFSWAAFYGVDRTLNRHVANGCGATSWLSGCSRYVLTHVRHHLGLLLLPLLLVVAYQDAALWLWPDAPGGELPLFVYLPLLAGMVVLLPFLLRCVWPTEPLAAGELRSNLQSVSDRLSVPVREIFVWKTHRMIANAAVAGVLPRMRYVFLSDSLLASIPGDQITAIYAHELGHVRHRHLLLRVMTSLLPLVVWMAIFSTFPSVMSTFDAMIGEMGLPVVAASPLILLSIMVVYARTVMAAYSRLLEHQADLTACLDGEFDGENDERMCPAATETFIQALERLTLLSGQRLDDRGWLHPSTQERIAFLHAMSLPAAIPDAVPDAVPDERDPLRVFQVRMRRLARMFVLLFAMAVGWWALAALL